MAAELSAGLVDPPAPASIADDAGHLAPPASTAAFLTGDWLVQRNVTDSLTGGTGSWRGTASVAPMTLRLRPDRLALRYQERGTLEWAGRSTWATRSWWYLPDGGRVRVVFDDGAPFHDLDLREADEVAEHLCGADRYLGRFGVSDSTVGVRRWWTEWTVTGPAKHHVLSTTYLEAPARRGSIMPWT